MPLVLCYDPGISHDMLILIFDAHVHFIVLQSGDRSQSLRSGDIAGSVDLRCQELLQESKCNV